jgi:hypothetical protein
MSRLSRKCGFFNISQAYRPPRHVTRTALLSDLHILLSQKMELFITIAVGTSNQVQYVVLRIGEFLPRDDRDGCVGCMVEGGNVSVDTPKGN